MDTMWKSTTAGILTIIAGAFNLVVGISLVAAGYTILGPWCGWFWGMEAIGIPLIVIGAISVIGGSFAIKRRFWWLALVGAICALFPPPVTILGILSIIFVSLAKSDFT